MCRRRLQWRTEISRRPRTCATVALGLMEEAMCARLNRSLACPWLCPTLFLSVRALCAPFEGHLKWLSLARCGQRTFAFATHSKKQGEREDKEGQ